MASQFYTPVCDNKVPSLVASLFSWRCLAASTSYFLHAAINLRPPSVTVSTHTSAFKAVALVAAGRLSEVRRRWGCEGGGGDVATEDRSSVPDIQTLDTVMSACGRALQWELALEMMRQAREQWGLHLTRVTYNTAIAACGRSGQAKRAVELLTEIREADLVPDTISFNSTSAGYA